MLNTAIAGYRTKISTRITVRAIDTMPFLLLLTIVLLGSNIDSFKAYLKLHNVTVMDNLVCGRCSVIQIERYIFKKYINSFRHL